MSDCCNPSQPSVSKDPRCRQCGENGRRVLRETVTSLLRPKALERLLDVPYSFDRTPACGVVYFSNEADSYFLTDDVKVRVGSKEPESPTPLCYCFGHTDESVRDEIAATGRSTVIETITAEVRAGNCSCEVKNPSGRCCLGEVNRAVHRIEREVRVNEPVAELQKG